MKFLVGRAAGVLKPDIIGLAVCIEPVERYTSRLFTADRHIIIRYIHREDPYVLTKNISWHVEEREDPTPLKRGGPTTVTPHDLESHPQR